MKNHYLKKLIKNYKHSVGFGLHSGWAIEGAIGSHHKIEASYLSPNVNIAARLQSATSMYGVDILLSGEFVNLLSTPGQKLCRMIDLVQVKGSHKVVELFTIDLPSDPITYLKEHMHDYSGMDATVKIITKLDHIFKWRHSYFSSNRDFCTDVDLKMVSSYQTGLKAFYDAFSEGFSLYRTEDWVRAHEWLSKALKLKTDDGPCIELLRVIKERKYKPTKNFSRLGRFLSKKC